MVIQRDIVWRRIADDLSFEIARLTITPAGPALSGTVLAAEDGAPLRVDYKIECDPTWRTRSVIIEQTLNGALAVLRLVHDGVREWTVNGHPAPHLSGCVDIDLGVNPSTNALAINRLALAVGASGETLAAWVRFPALDSVQAKQAYTRLDRRLFRYRSLASGFEVTLTVDDNGLPVDYGKVWKQVASTRRSPGACLRRRKMLSPQAYRGPLLDGTGDIVR